MDISSLAYKRAFGLYLRRGTPIALSLKQARTTTHYIWRTRKDGKVRHSHAANDGKIFAWNNPPATGHPGEEYGCRCSAQSFQPNLNEYINIILSGISDRSSPWSSGDFVDHYFNGGGRGVTVRRTGHLRNITQQYIRLAEVSLQNNIARIARRNLSGSFYDDFYRTYDMEGVVFSIGNTTIGGLFSGQASRNSDEITFQGEIEFYLRDEFVDPLGLGVEVIDLGKTIVENIHRPLDDYLRGKPTGPINYGIHTGEPYSITDKWSGSFDGMIHADNTISNYG